MQLAALYSLEWLSWKDPNLFTAMGLILPQRLILPQQMMKWGALLMQMHATNDHRARQE